MILFYKIYKYWLDFQEQCWNEEQAILERKNKIEEQRNKHKKKIATSKIVLWFMLFLLLTIIIFTGYVTLNMMSIAAAIGTSMDFTPLVALISAIVGQVIITLGYFIKSGVENREGGIIFEKAKFELENGGVG